MNDIFISYAAEDKERARVLSEALVGKGYSVWWDKRIPPGKTWDQVIGKALNEAKCVIVLWSRVSVESTWVREEADTGNQRGVLVPALIDDVKIPMGFRLIEAANLVSWNGEPANPEFEQLLESVSGLVAREPAAAVPVGPAVKEASPSAFSGLWQKIERHSRLAVLAVLVVMAVVTVVTLAAVFKLSPLAKTGPPSGQAAIPTYKTLRIWKVGSPHEGDTPDVTVPFGIQVDAEKIGLKLSIESFPAQGFATKFFEAVKQKEEPDILAIDNYGIIDGISTKLGNFTGIGQSNSIRNTLLPVSGSLAELEGRGWQFLITTSKNHEAAKSLVLQPAECKADWASSVKPLEGELKEVVPGIASAYLEGAAAVLQRYDDPARLRVAANATEKIRAGMVHPCGNWGNDNLAFVPVVATFEGNKSIGQAVILIILRRQAAHWQLLAVAKDPLSTGEFAEGIPRLVGLLGRDRGTTPSPAQAVLVAPGDGQAPQPAAGERFGDFVWRPSSSANVVAEIIEFAYQDDARFFMRIRSGPAKNEDRLPSGYLWSTGSIWKWRVWAVSDSGDVSFSEIRSFPN